MSREGATVQVLGEAILPVRRGDLVSLGSTQCRIDRILLGDEELEWAVAGMQVRCELDVDSIAANASVELRLPAEIAATRAMGVYAVSRLSAARALGFLDRDPSPSGREPGAGFVSPGVRNTWAIDSIRERASGAAEDEAVDRDRSGRLISAVALYEDALKIGYEGFGVRTRLANLYWFAEWGAGECSDAFRCRAACRWRELDRRMTEEYPEEVSVAFWARVRSDWVDGDTTKDWNMTCFRELAERDPYAMLPKIGLFCASGGKEERRSLRAMADACRVDGTTGARFLWFHISQHL